MKAEDCNGCPHKMPEGGWCSKHRLRPLEQCKFTPPKPKEKKS